MLKEDFFPYIGQRIAGHVMSEQAQSRPNQEWLKP